MKCRFFLILSTILVIVIGLQTFCIAKIDNNLTIKISGSTTVLPIVAKASERFMEYHPDVRIIVNPSGSGVGVKTLGNGLIDIGMVSRNITAEEKKYFKDIDFRVFTVGRDAVSYVVSSEIYKAGVKKLSKEQIAKIYLGEIVNWKEVGGPDKKIFCVDKERHRGTRHVFMNYLFGNNRARTPGVDLVAGSNNEEQTKISLSDTAIGMLSNAWISDSVKGVGIDINGEPNGIVKEFINYMLSDNGQQIVKETGYVAIK